MRRERYGHRKAFGQQRQCAGGVGRSHGSADDAGGDRHRHQLLEEQLAGVGDVDLGYLRTRTERKH